MSRVKILFFIGALKSGGKERRLMELMTFLKKDSTYDMEIVLTSDEIHFPEFHKLDIPYELIKKKWSKYDPFIIFQFYKICRNKKPHLIHSWGRMQSLYTLPAVLLLGIPLVNSQITSAPPKINRFSFSYLLDQLIFMCSTSILVNSKAGMKFFNPPRKKSKLIYNGLNLKRFDNLTNKEIIKKKYHIKTKYAVIMVATVSPKKDYDLFFKIAENILQQRNDITFIGVGPYYEKDPMYKKIKRITEHPRLIFTGMINEVEALVNACDIGVLFSPQGEGLSNTILEYMALGKPVVANDLGGNRELIITGKNGYLVERPSIDEISKIILGLIKNRKKCKDFGETSKQIITERFNIEKMGRAFDQVYTNILDQHTKKTILFSEQ